MQRQIHGEGNFWRGAAALALLVVLALSTGACSSGNMEVSPRPGAEDEELLDQTDWPSASGRQVVNGCADGETRVCSYYLPEHNGVRPCVIGYQICADHMWSHCTEGVLVDAGAAVDAGAPSND